jgi:hypothetical protein
MCSSPAQNNAAAAEVNDILNVTIPHLSPYVPFTGSLYGSKSPDNFNIPTHIKLS